MNLEVMPDMLNSKATCTANEDGCGFTWWRVHREVAVKTPSPDQKNLTAAAGHCVSGSENSLTVICLSRLRARESADTARWRSWLPVETHVIELSGVNLLFRRSA
jgi:hypothetical protein